MNNGLPGIILWAFLLFASPLPQQNPRSSFEGTWLTDQGALVVSEEGDRLSGIFLPISYPCAFFKAGKDGNSLYFHDPGDRNLRWEASLALTDDGFGIEGKVALKGSAEKLPCRGKRIGSSSGNGVPALLKALEHEDVWTRRSGADALGALGPAGREAVPALVHALGDGNEDVRRRAAFALVRLGAAAPAAVPALCCHLKDASPGVRRGAAEALGAVGAPAAETLSDLVCALEDPDGAAKTAAMDALIRIGSGAAPALSKALNGADRPVVDDVIQALRRKGASSKEVLALLAASLTDDLSMAAACNALGEVGAESDRACGEETGRDWPQWRGPDKDNVSRETGLLKEWPKEGPPLVWEVWGIGESIAAPAVRDGRVYALGFLNGWEYVTALDAENGRCLWTAGLGPGVLENSHMRWVAQRTPTAGRDLVYAYMNSGELVCLRARDGQEEWRVDYTKLFGGRVRDYGFTDHPILDGDRLICTPASEKGPTIAALDPGTGRVLWKSLAPDAPGASSPSTVAMELGDVRQYVVSCGGLHGFRASDGRRLWSYSEIGRQGWQVQTPMAAGGNLLLARKDWSRIVLLKFSSAPEGGSLQAVYARRQNFGWLQDSNLVLDSRLYVPNGSTLQSLGLDAGTEVRVELSHGTGREASMICADRHLYVLGNSGRLALIELSQKEMTLRSSFEIPMFVSSSGTSNPVIARGRLYIRDSDRLLCYDVREKPPAEGRPEPKRQALEPPAAPPAKGGSPRAAYVSTPHDLVTRMLREAALRDGDVVYDLGSGDGRILIEARKLARVRAIGYEIDEELVKSSREAVRDAGYADHIRIESQDLLTADVSEASLVALYLPEQMLTQLKPQLDKLKPGSRIVSHEFRIPGLIPDKELTIDSSEDGRRHTLYLWTAPLRRSKE
jgi:outer membrane protein assembly factor BamB